MVNKQISLGTVITILTILSTFIFTLGATSNRIESVEIDIEKNSQKILNSQDKQQKIEVDIGKLETKLDEGFKRLETLIIEN
tara:strand:+ start:3978 stop:4223 length:246 start_codon:yes stop_codon:yes gene_type:complete